MLEILVNSGFTALIATIFVVLVCLFWKKNRETAKAIAVFGSLTTLSVLGTVFISYWCVLLFFLPLVYIARVEKSKNGNLDDMGWNISIIMILVICTIMVPDILSYRHDISYDYTINLEDNGEVHAEFDIERTPDVVYEVIQEEVENVKKYNGSYAGEIKVCYKCKASSKQHEGCECTDTYICDVCSKYIHFVEVIK